jgi:Zn-dependent peptidase ImmA (M78 family)
LHELEPAFPKLESWENGESGERPTLKQIERFAKAVRVPIGYLFLPEPPVESLPIPDLRTVGNVHIGHPSPDLLDTIHICQRRQEWYREFANSVGDTPLPFVGSARLTDTIEDVAAHIRNALRFDLEERRRISTWTEALGLFVEQAEGLGVMVMCSGVVGTNNHRALDPDEFRGFAMSDDLAPLVFINGADTKAAQMFTLAHELAHIWLGQSALSDVEAASLPTQQVELWSNKVAAELLLPLDALRGAYNAKADLQDEVIRLARRFKVSTLVILRRVRDAGKLNRVDFENAYAGEIARLRALSKKRKSGGDFCPTEWTRVGKRFSRALIASTLEGQTLYRDALRLLGFWKVDTFNELGRRLGVRA